MCDYDLWTSWVPLLRHVPVPLFCLGEQSVCPRSIPSVYSFPAVPLPHCQTLCGLTGPSSHDKDEDLFGKNFAAGVTFAACRMSAEVSEVK